MDKKMMRKIDIIPIRKHFSVEVNVLFKDKRYPTAEEIRKTLIKNCRLVGVKVTVNGYEYIHDELSK